MVLTAAGAECLCILCSRVPCLAEEGKHVLHGLAVCGCRPGGRQAAEQQEKGGGGGGASHGCARVWFRVRKARMGMKRGARPEIPADAGA